MPNIIKICPNIAKMLWFTSKMDPFPPYLHLATQNEHKIPHLGGIYAILGWIWVFLCDFVQIYVHFDPVIPIFADEHPKITKNPPTPPHICNLGPKTGQKRTKTGQKRPKTGKFDPFSKTFCKNCPTFYHFIEFYQNILQ